MKFAHTQDQLDLRDGAREYLRGRCTVEQLRDLKDNNNAELGIWAELVEQGLLGYMVSEQRGGLEMDQVGFALIAEEAGYVALPEPFVDVAGICAPALDTLGSDIAGELTESLIMGRARVRSLHSANPYLNQLVDGDQLLVADGDSIRLLDASNYQSKAIESIDPLRRLHAIEAEKAAGAVLAQGADASRVTLSMMNHGALFTAAELLGLSAAMIDMATAYAKERKQFGNVIGSYQAVKHHLASAFVALEFARPVVYRASAELAAQSDKATLSVAHAKIAASNAAVNAAEVAIQIHGGMGYTFEVDLHLWMKRAWALIGQWGTTHHHMNNIETAIFTGLATGPAETFNNPIAER